MGTKIYKNKVLETIKISINGWKMEGNETVLHNTNLIHIFIISHILHLVYNLTKEIYIHTHNTSAVVDSTTSQNLHGPSLRELTVK